MPALRNRFSRPLFDVLCQMTRRAMAHMRATRLNALRLVDGFEWSTFEARTGLSREAAEATCADCARDDLLEPVAGGGWRPTERGFRYLNDLQARFLA